MQKIYALLVWVSLSLLINHSTLGQKNYVKGYVILPSSDTLSGFIDDQNWEKNPQEILFKKAETSSIQKFKPGQINGFGLQSGENYSSQVILVDKTPTDLPTLVELAKQPNNFLVSDTVFLTVLVKGFSALYYLKDENAKVHYLFQKADGNISELIQRKSVKENKGQYFLETFDIYKGQLSNFMADCSPLHSVIQNTNYRQSELLKLVQKYNYFKAGKSGQIAKIKSTNNVHMGLLVGVSSTILSFSGQSNANLVTSKFENNVNYVVGLNLEYVLQRNRRKWSFHNELAWKPYQTQSTYENIKSTDNYEKGTYTFKFGYLGLINMLRYTWPASHIKPFFNAGIAQNLALTAVNEHTKTVHFYAPDKESKEAALADYRKYEQAFVVGTGITSNKISAEIRLEKGNGMSNYSALKSSKRMVQVIISYRLDQ